MADKRNPIQRTPPTSVTLSADLRADVVRLAQQNLSNISQTVRKLVQEGIERRKRHETRDDGA